MTKIPKLKPKIAPPVHFEWRWHNGEGGDRRVWRSDWFGDQFEILGSSAFVELLDMAKRFSFPVKEAEDNR